LQEKPHKPNRHHQQRQRHRTVTLPLHQPPLMALPVIALTPWSIVPPPPRH
jgi:hypothetical protein